MARVMWWCGGALAPGIQVSERYSTSTSTSAHTHSVRPLSPKNVYNTIHLSLLPLPFPPPLYPGRLSPTRLAPPHHLLPTARPPIPPTIVPRPTSQGRTVNPKPSPPLTLGPPPPPTPPLSPGRPRRPTGWRTRGETAALPTTKHDEW